LAGKKYECDSMVPDTKTSGTGISQVLIKMDQLNTYIETEDDIYKTSNYILFV